MTEVVAAVIEREGRVLICQRPAHKARGLLWEFAGGKVEPGETKAQALARECREELGITVEPGEVFLKVTHAYPDLTVHLTVLRAGLAEGEPQLLEHADLRWVTAAELPGFAFCPADGAIVQKLRQG
ncbi:pyrimidine (deoxy)nucleoside triphosphate pyrophosphohydrolase [Oscillospiraceae bacterium]|nr:pyrimidine (deoxy)nucleoside triphosphate pyrophosphohydrolase [Oscillospiraceae bacterium]